jgi:hypothetical protein
MMRKSLFWGLTLILIAVIVNLMIRGRRLEKERAGQVVEAIQESKPSPTRVLGPRNLEIVRSKMIVENESDIKRQSYTARYEIEIQNSGSVPYGEICLGFTYLDGKGNILATKTRSINRTLMPGADLTISDIMIDDIPATTTNSRATIVYADIGRAPEPQISDPKQ